MYCAHKKKLKLIYFWLALCLYALFGHYGYVHAQNCPENIVAYWQFNEGETTVFADSIGNNNGFCEGIECPTLNPEGKIGYGLAFDGIDDRIEVASNAAFNWATTESFTIEFWMKTDPGSTCAGNQVIVGRDDTSTNLHWWVGCKDGGQAAFYLYDRSGFGSGISGTKDLANGFWHHIAAVRDADAGGIWLYVDGVSEASQIMNFSAGFDSTTAVLNIGSLNLSPGYYFQGVVDEVALYNRALSEKEIGSHYYISRGYCDMCSNPIRIMPLGDSITRGYSASATDNNYIVGYRQNLYLDLIEGGHSNVDFVGSQSSGMLAQPLFDIHHEGRGGWCADGCPPQYGDIRDYVYTFLANNPADVVLLHIGTNDISGDNENPAEVGEILDEIYRYSPDITVVLARIISRTDGKALQTTLFNNAVEALALGRIANGDKIIMVDMESALNYPGDMADALHPNQTGYNKMANVWLLELNCFLPACSQAVPRIVSTPVTQAMAGQVYSYDVNATGNPAPTYALTTYPAGMTINQTTGLIQWAPTVAGQFNVTVEASNTQGVATQSFAVTVNPEASSVYVWLEAESGSIVAPMVVASDSQASSGQYVWVPNGTGNVFDPLQSGGTVTHTFTVPVAGNYVVWGRVMVDTSAGADDDSLFVSMDSGSYSLWDTLRGTLAVWGWDLVNNRGGADPVVYPLSAGQHTLKIKQREDGTKLDRILITDDMAYVPQGMGEVLSSVPEITSVPVTQATAGQVYSYDVNATGNPAPTYALTTYPAGMTINQTTGLIQWAPTVAGQFNVTVEASNTQGVATQSFAVTVNPEASSVYVWLEAESGSIVAPMVVASDSQASSGQYVWVPNGTGNVFDPLQSGGTVTHTFTVPVAGNYVVWGRVMVDTSAGADDDSLFVSMDSGSYSLWDTLRGTLAVWGWDLVNNRGGADPVVYPLSAGQHTLKIKQREDGTKLDRILITDDMAYVPQGMGE
jgi:lysophospholipase L1-like esterase